ncbi:hypothetical protein AUF78_11405 [archaeon 13_1_20CM_2_51_12]|nr:MAG: hypothetical protein AUF78_11405 [archaeon 13_1_20CM_2_51_12]
MLVPAPGMGPENGSGSLYILGSVGVANIFPNMGFSGVLPTEPITSRGRLVKPFPSAFGSTCVAVVGAPAIGGLYGFGEW